MESGGKRHLMCWRCQLGAGVGLSVCGAIRRRILIDILFDPT